MALTFIIITLLYLTLIGSFIYGFDKVDSFLIDELEPATKFSVIIPFRNEAENIENLLTSLSNLNYPKSHYELILVDDASEDNTVSLIEKFNSKFDNITLISNVRKTESPKKDAITEAIKHAKYDWIVTTDADCIAPKFWLDAYNQFIQKNVTFCIAAPVSYSSINGFLDAFQLLDFLSLQGATLGSFGIKKPILCNGANFAYQKKLFIDLNGFEGNSTIASGDDIFLLEKAIKKSSEHVHYLKANQAIIRTQPQTSLKKLIAQRKRWAAKTSKYSNTFGKGVGLLVLFMNATLLCSLLLTLIGHFSYSTFLYLFIIKFSVDFLLLFKTAGFFNQKLNLINYLFASAIYPFFTVYIACVSMFSKYKWKGRSFKN